MVAGSISEGKMQILMRKSGREVHNANSQTHPL